MSPLILEAIAVCTDEIPQATIADITRILRNPSDDIDRLAVHRQLHSVARLSFDRLCDTWIAVNGNARAAELASALEVAAYQAGHMRRSSSIELVWTGPSIFTDRMRSTEQTILEVVSSARRSLDIVAFAAYKVPSLRRAIDDAISRGVRVRLVLESKKQSDGKVTFDPAEGLGLTGRADAEIYVWPLEQRLRSDRGQSGALHAKFVLADSTALFVSSANLTEYAMNLNLELGVLIRGGVEPGHVGAMIDGLIQRGVLKRMFV